MVITKYSSYLAFILIAIATEALSKDLGKHGASFPIVEEGFTAMMKRKLSNIDLNSQQKEMQELAKRKVEEPDEVAGITRTEKQIEYSFDPSYVLGESIYLPDGKLLYAAGTRVNPLDYMNWEDELVFIDARDAEQVAWVKDNYINREKVELIEDKGNTPEMREDTSSKGIAKIVLIGGRPFELERETNTRIYFDQLGELTKKFNILHVPAVVEQDGKLLKVTEVYIEK